MVGRNDPLARVALPGLDTPAGVLVHLAVHGTAVTQAAAAGHPNLPREAVEALAGVRAPKVRAAVLGRTRLDRDTARTALAGPLTAEVVTAALLCDALDEADLDRVVDWLDTSTRRQARGLLATSRVIDDLAGHARTRRMLLTRVNLPSSAFVRLLDAETDEDVVAAAVAAMLDQPYLPWDNRREGLTVAASGSRASVTADGKRRLERRARRLAPAFRTWLDRDPDHRLADTWARMIGRDSDVLGLAAVDVRGATGILRHGTALATAITNRFGDDLHAWQTVAELLTTWDGTVAAALDAAAALRDA